MTLDISRFSKAFFAGFVKEMIVYPVLLEAR